jgi:carbon-monoxide dehydrogenase medium subunit
MNLWAHYHLPRSIDEALASLSAYDGKAQLVGGGTDLILELQQGRKPPVAALVDVTRILEMNHIAEHDGFIYVGAAVTHTNIMASELLTNCATCLVESCGVIGGPQVRNVATLGGNVAHALPAGDGTISLIALDAEAEVATMDDGRQTAGANRQSPVVRRQWKPVLSLFVGPGKSAVDNHRELIVQFRFRAADVAKGEATAFKRIMRPQGVALPILNMAVWLKMSGEIVDEIRITLGPAGAIPLRATQAETYLTGIPLVDDVIPQAADLVAAEAHLRTSPHRATAEYRAELIPVLFERAIKLAHRRATTGEVVPEGLGLA